MQGVFEDKEEVELERANFFGSKIEGYYLIGVPLDFALFLKGQVLDD